jgi:DNA-binding NarL/FixJ family response regulator
MNISGQSLNTPKRYKVLIVDDHPIVRRGLADLIAKEPDLEVCGEAGDIADAMDCVEKNCPDVVIVDITLKSGQGLDLIEQIKAKNEEIKMLVSSVHDEKLFAERSLRAGALGYILKEESTENLLGAIRKILRGEIYLSTRMTSRLMHNIAGKPTDGDPIGTLSNREMEVFEMIGQGLTTQNIARKLSLSPKTIETHRENIKGKLNLKNSAELNRRAVQWVLESS